MVSFLKTRQQIAADLSRYPERAGVKGFIRAYFLHPGFKFTVWARLTKYIRQHHLFRHISFIFIFLFFRLRERTGIQISYAMEIGSGLYIPHFGGIVVNQGCRFGQRVYLSHNVTIGKTHAGPKKGVPFIGSDVYIGPGAVILGDIKIGNNAVIGANSVVISDVPDGIFVAGAPAKPVKEMTSSVLLGNST